MASPDEIPKDETWTAEEVSGLVRQELHLSLRDLRHMQRQTQTTLHWCIQGWSYFAQWAGVPRLRYHGRLPAVAERALSRSLHVG
jgi:DMSO/TMAO reductase YedYZ molybdopterin-dependent catalytic subunit